MTPDTMPPCGGSYGAGETAKIMKILAIETSCDETAIALINGSGNPQKGGMYFDVLSNIVLSQAKLHEKYGGVYPSLAKREHAKNLIPLLKQAFKESNLLQKSNTKKIPNAQRLTLNALLKREPELLKQFLEFIPTIEKPKIDKIVVTHGPGLEPALWVGINFAKALGEVWDIPVSGINHMEGHIFSALLKKESGGRFLIFNFQFPVLALLISGGHTELILSKDWLQYKIVGETKDDAVGEAFDKVARMLGLPYPGGPEISKQAAKFQIVQHQISRGLKLPRPMIDSKDFNFSFSGLKTAVLYKLKKIKKLTPVIIQEFSHEFQEAVTDVLVQKTIGAAQKYGVKTIVVGGGVSANKIIRERLSKEISKNLPDIELFLAPQDLTGDNALMIAVAGYFRTLLNKERKKDITAHGTLRLQ